MSKNKNHQKSAIEHQKLHEPVLQGEVLKYLDPKAGERYLDLTGGYGGHASAILEQTGFAAQAVLVDRDEEAVSTLQSRFKSDNVSIRHADFLSASQDLADEQQQFDLIVADLGLSSQHLNQKDRGFAFALEGPLDMRMDQRQELTAQQVVNGYPERKIAEIIRAYGEEPRVASVARAIIRSRPISSTKQLAEVVARAYGARKGKSRVHPATKTFQALRIAVNDELEQLEHALPLWLDALLAPGGRLAVISFHSLEDRLVKQAMRERSDGLLASIKLITRRPVTPTSDEIVYNPRARSAKLRVCQRK